MQKKILARWALIEPSRIGLASYAGLPDADDRFLYRPKERKRRIQAYSAWIDIESVSLLMRLQFFVNKVIFLL